MMRALKQRWDFSPENYVVEFTIQGLPPTINEIGRKHWAIKEREIRKWKDEVAMAVRGYLPREPLGKAKLTLTRYSSVPVDPDNLAGSFKAIVDGLVDLGILSDDGLKNIGMPEFRWEKAEPKKGMIRVKVEEVC